VRLIYETTFSRVVSYAKATERSEEIILERKIGSKWERYLAFDTMSNDYAYTEARAYADKLNSLK
jgi:hypothetical protein